MNKKTSVAVALAVMIGAGIGPAQSELVGKGLIHPVNGFPTWFSDSNGVVLQMCLDGNGVDGPCFYDEVIPDNAFSVETGFGPEAFWWSAEAAIDHASGGALLVLALEAAYANEDPAPGDQFAFGRVRLRIDTPVAGQYTVYHPYLDEANGCLPEVFDAEAGIRAINVTRDIGGEAPFDTMLAGEVGPFLVWDPNVMPTAPTGYVGDPTVEHTVVGGHCGINYFRVEAPTGVNLDGNGNNWVQTDLFSVQGKIYDEASIPPAISPVRATYLRSTGATSGNSTTRLNLWVQAPPTATVAVSGLPQGDGPMVDPDGNGVFFRRLGFNNANSQTLPDQVAISATNAAGTTVRQVTLSDSVDITRASWSNASDSLSITATSSDRIRDALLRPTLTAIVNGASIPLTISTTPGRYTATVPSLPTPPAFITVTSSEGGSDTQQVAD